MPKSSPDLLEQIFSLSEAVELLQVTADDVSDPERWVRDRVRTWRLPIVKVGRTVKLPWSTVAAIRELSTIRPGQRDDYAPTPAVAREVLARLLEPKRPRRKRDTAAALDRRMDEALGISRPPKGRR